MSRLPLPGQDAGTWGTILNDYLSQSLAADGTIKASTIGSVQLQNDAITNAALADASVQAPTLDTVAAPTSNQVLSYNGTRMTWVTPPATPVTSVAGKTGIVTLDKTDVGLTNVDNTSDTNKPLSTATTTALASKADTTTVAASIAAVSTAATGTLVVGQIAQVDATSTAATRTLPAAATAGAGAVVAAKKVDATVNVVTVNPAGSDTVTSTVPGSTSVALALAGEAIELVSDGTSRWIVRASDIPKASLDATYGPFRGSSFVAIGDSITAGGSSFLHNIHADVWPTPFALATGLRLVKNVGIGGNTTTQMLARFDSDVLANASDFVVIMGGTNDSLDGSNLPTVTAQNIAAMVKKTRAAGRLPVLLTIPPAGTPASPATATVLLKIATINSWIRRFARDQRIDLIDVYQAITDSATGAWSASDMTGDGTHPSTKASRIMGQYIASKFGQRCAAAEPPLLVSNADPLNLVPNGCFLSMSGWVTYGGSGGSYTDTTPADPGNVVGNWLQTMRTSPGDLRVHAEKSILPSASTFAIGDEIEVSFRISTTGLEATGTSRATLGVAVRCNGGTPNSITNIQIEADVAAGLWIARAKIPAGTTDLTAQIITNKQAGTPAYGPVKVGQFAVRNLTKSGALL